MRKKWNLLAIIISLILLSGCGHAGAGNAETEVIESADNTELQKESETNPDEDKTVEGDKADEVLEKDTYVTKEGEVSDVTLEEVNKDESFYRNILDMYYNKISNGWDGNENVSNLFLYYPVTLDDVGYAFADLDGNGISELLVSSVNDASDGMVDDLYTCEDGEIIHLASSTERGRYYLTDKNEIYEESSGGASLTGFEKFRLYSSEKKLKCVESIVYNSDEDQDNPWFYGTDVSYDEYTDYDYKNMKKISDEEAEELLKSYKGKKYELNLFREYTVQEKTDEKVKESVVEVNDYFDFPYKLQERLKMEINKDNWQNPGWNSYKSDEFFLESDGELFSMKCEGNQNVSLYGIKIGDKKESVLEKLKGEKVSHIDEGQNGIYQYRMQEDKLLMMDFSFDKENYLIKWYVNNWPEGEDIEEIKNTLEAEKSIQTID